MRSVFSIIIFFLPLVSAFTFSSIPSNLTSGGPATITWTSTDTDPTVFSLELVNPTEFNNAIAVANNVPTSQGSITVTLPIVAAGSGYTLEAVDIGNINSVYGTSGEFSIGATVSSSTSSTSTPLSSGNTTIPTGSTSTTGSGSTLTSSRTSVSSGSSSGTSSSPQPSSSSFNGNGAPGSNIGSGIGGSIAAAVVGVIAGAVFV